MEPKEATLSETIRRYTPSLTWPKRRGLARKVASSLLCAAVAGCCQPNDPTCRNVRIGPSGGEVAGYSIGVGAAVATVVAVEVHHAHHTLNACISDGPEGQLQSQSGARTYTLTGDTAGIVAGERFRLHGTRVKQPKHSTTNPTFLVERASKDYGPCKPKPASSGTNP